VASLNVNDFTYIYTVLYSVICLLVICHIHPLYLEVHDHGQTHLWYLCRPQLDISFCIYNMLIFCFINVWKSCLSITKNGATLRYAEKSDLGKWPEMTSMVEHSQCLPINFNIFNDKKYCVASQLQQYVRRKCYFIMLMFLCIFYVDDVFNCWCHQPVNMAVFFLAFS